ncbi:hypothetical protein AAFF_G00106130 [Aldrovandia affinis]|uniref:Uncharacterized protein n=1 Tax=Aldrovandia affinis TaxID=143900 RepID=A0AAD7T3Z5_9TELE|nr:hypothetical protein AAFF_G00106130 [Aldrovandia affinis]
MEPGAEAPPHHHQRRRPVTHGLDDQKRSCRDHARIHNKGAGYCTGDNDINMQGREVAAPGAHISHLLQLLTGKRMVAGPSVTCVRQLG